MPSLSKGTVPRVTTAGHGAQTAPCGRMHQDVVIPSSLPGAGQGGGHDESDEGPEPETSSQGHEAGGDKPTSAGQRQQVKLTLPVLHENANSCCYLSPKTPGVDKGTLSSCQCVEAAVTKGSTFTNQDKAQALFLY